MNGLAPSRSGTQWSLRRRAIAICVLLGVVLAFLAAGATATAIANRGQLATLLDSVGPLRASSTTLTTDLLNQETAVRGYVLNGEAVNLGPYYQGLRDAQRQIERISANPATTPEVRFRLETVTRLAYTWRTSFAEPAIDAMERGDQQRAKELLDDTARQQFEQVRSALDALEAAILTVREQAEATVRDTSSTLLFVLIAVAVMMLAAGGGLLVALQRSVIGPVTHLAAQVRAVSRGNYRLQISAPGPPELQHLAQDVDTMRQRIAAELAEVRAAQRQIAQAHAALEQQAAELVRSNRDLEQFAYVASHDLQEPLRKVASFCQLLQRRYQHQLDERADQYLAFAVAGAQRMQRLISDLLAFSRIGRNTRGFTELDLETVARDAADQAGGETAKVTWSDLPVVRGEETLLTTLLANLIGNAVKFARPGVTPDIQLSARRTGAFWEISCADNGIGIEPEYREKVFAIFQRLHPRDAYPGTGIGLAVAKKIVEYHGGEIWVDPDQAEGSAIRFTLPAGEPDAPLGKEAIG